MSSKQFFILIGTGIFCALLFAAPGLYTAFNTSEISRMNQVHDGSGIEPSSPGAADGQQAELALSLEKYQELKLEQVRERAASSDASAQYELGRRYDSGEGVDEDDIEAMKWYLSSAKLGVPEAQVAIAAAYSLGWLKSKDGKKEAFNWYLRAANQGFVEAQVAVAKCYADGDGVEKNAVEAEKWFRKAAEGGDGESAFKIAEIAGAKAKTDKDPKAFGEVVRWMLKAAELGHAEAQFEMGGLCIFQDVPNVAHDLGAAAAWWKKAAENGNAEAKKFISEEFYRNQQSGPYTLQRKVMLYIKATENDDPEAAWELGSAYANGQYPFKKTNSEAVKWLGKAAEKGHAVAQTNLGRIYLSGDGIQKNPSLAFQLFEKAAQNGYAHAQSGLSHCYEYGLGCEKNLVTALMWATIANLSDPGNKALLEALGNTDGAERLKKLMSPEEIERAESLARDLHLKFNRNR